MVVKCVRAPVYTHRADRMQEAEDSNLCKQRKHGTCAQTELARRYGQGKCRKVQGMRARWTHAGMVHACNEHIRAKGFVDVDLVDVNAAGNLRA